MSGFSPKAFVLSAFPTAKAVPDPKYEGCWLIVVDGKEIGSGGRSARGAWENAGPAAHRQLNPPAPRPPLPPMSEW